MGTWPEDEKQKELGAYALLAAEQALEGFGIALFTRTLGMEAQEAMKLIEGAKKESRSRKIHSHVMQ